MPETVTALYVPGNRPDRFEKAIASGADLVILDLEDAVPGPEKATARDAVVAWLTARGIAGVEVRVNPGSAEDLEVARGLGVPIRLPKIESPDKVPEGLAVTALIETALGVERAAKIAAHPSVVGLAVGESDLASDLGTAAPPAIEYARVRTVYAARAAGLPAPMMSAYPRIADLDGLRSDTERGRDLGQFGRTAVHPSQLAVIRSVFSISDADRAWAIEVLEAAEGGGVVRIRSGEMVDDAMRGRARSILARDV